MRRRREWFASARVVAALGPATCTRVVTWDPDAGRWFGRCVACRARTAAHLLLSDVLADLDRLDRIPPALASTSPDDARGREVAHLARTRADLLNA